MPTEAHRQRNKRYKETKEQIVLLVPKGAREGVKQHAGKKNKSVNAYIVELIEHDMGCTMNDLVDQHENTQD